MSFPRMLLVKQNFPDRKLNDIAGAVEGQLSGAGFGRNLKPGASVAIGVGSRGISNIATIVKAVVAYWRSKGMKPFIFPAMGSHGAATAEGQADVLAHYGIIEETAGCPVRSSLDVISLGRTPEGIEAFLDKHASESDGIMLVGRIKQHTDFAGKIESGLFKMMGIGLGKWAGAKNYHTHAYKLGMEAVIRSVGAQVLNSGKILGGLAVLEDAYHNTAKLTAIPVERMLAAEEELLELVKAWAPGLPFDLDVLVINEIGKQFSGAGMDTKVVNRGTQGEYNPWPNTPHVERIFLRGLSSASYGNGVGLGLADVVHDRLAARLDTHPTWINALTASTPSAAKLPIHFSTDRECLERICLTVGKHRIEDVRIGWIENTMELTPMALSENMRAEIVAHPLLEVVEDSHDLPFNAEGNLRDDVFTGARVGQHAAAH
ncbi:MAG: nickel-dependent lactate racemase [Acidobacteriota bacterium]|nr:nickel-dependent lactate racemase [Acidobacteriota bacterium]